MTVNDATGFSTSDDDLTNGETLILAKLELLLEQFEELSERVSNLNLTSNDGFGIEEG